MVSPDSTPQVPLSLKEVPQALKAGTPQQWCGAVTGYWQVPGELTFH